MSKLQIYHTDGTLLLDESKSVVEIGSFDYSDSWMGECFISATIKNATPILFKIGDYLIYRGERFEINYDPGKIKSAPYGMSGEGFVYNDVKFNSLSDELVRSQFLDVVLNDNELHYTALPKFSFYVETVDDLLDRIQANMDEQYGKGVWKLFSRNKSRSIQRGCTENEWSSVYPSGAVPTEIDSKTEVVDNKTCWDALSLVNTEWDVNFIIRNRNIYVDTTGVNVDGIFRYGKGNGLYEIEQNADQDQLIVTRLRAYGSEKNLPTRYYAEFGKRCRTEITEIENRNDGNYVTIKTDLDYKKEEFKTNREYVLTQNGSVITAQNDWVVKATIDNITTVTGIITEITATKKCRLYVGLHTGSLLDTGMEEDADKVSEFIKAVKKGAVVYIIAGIYTNFVSPSNIEYDSQIPNNMSVNRLMLPGFPNKSLKDYYSSLNAEEKKYVNPTGVNLLFSEDKHRPFVDSINISEIGMRPGSIFFDNDDKKNGIVDIYPTIEEMVVNGERIDEILTGSSIDDDGVYEDGQDAPASFQIYLKSQINFDLNDQKEDGFAIEMKDGKCGGRSFNIVSCEKQKDGSWKLELERTQDTALELYFPYRDYQIEAGNHFVLTGLTLPESYIQAASLKLLKYTIAYLLKNCVTRYVFQPKVDEIFMARQNDKAESDTTGKTKSLYKTLKAGDRMYIADNDLRFGAGIIIDQLTIHETEDKIPTYEITLRDNKEVGTLTKIQNQVDSIVSGTTSITSSISEEEIKSIVRSIGSKQFISKVSDDTAQGTITFEKLQRFLQGVEVGGKSVFKDGLQLGDTFVSGLNGIGGRLDGDGNGELRSLRLWGTLEVPELRYNKVSVFTGIRWDTVGGGLIERVEHDTDTNTGTIYLKLEDGEYGAVAVDDLCMGIWHDMSGGNNDNTTDDHQGRFTFAGFKTVYFHITAVGGEKNNVVSYVLRSMDDGGNGVQPYASMTFAVRGNITNKERQAFAYYTPEYLVSLHNVNTWEFSGSNYYEIRGKLDGFSMPAIDANGREYTKQFDGYGQVFGNAYMFGQIDQFERVGYRAFIDQSLGGVMSPSDTQTITMTILNGYGEDITKEFVQYYVVRTTGDEASDSVWNQKHTNVTNPWELTYDDLGIDGITKLRAVFTMYASDGTHTAKSSINYNV